MGQTTNERRVKDNEAMAMAKFLRTSPGKLNLVAAMIRGKAAGKAMVDLEFSNRRIAQDVRKVLASAVANAENNHNLDVDKLIVAEAYVGKSVKMRRFSARARGRAAPIEKHFSRLTIIVREGDAMKAAPKKPAPKKATPKSEAAAPKKETAKKPAAKKKAATKQDKE
ncbi:MAG: 50S ribosomal protein L22 [Micavibrio aeruginosavorus]|uniref:Large ribosomal subunit protein uL22 n=1 Tax=Micavibrio aeruginosavorus TaxID=349221 RepID=A0A2W5PKS3_9BACT|nr:MAG: 50S ribosomal protein L22 [Micavibrio aeruginosavorus]